MHRVTASTMKDGDICVTVVLLKFSASQVVSASLIFTCQTY